MEYGQCVADDIHMPRTQPLPGNVVAKQQELNMKKIAEIKGSTAGDIVKVFWDEEWEEFRAVPSWRKKASYHTGDKDDALMPAHAMMQERIKQLAKG